MPDEFSFPTGQGEFGESATGSAGLPDIHEHCSDVVVGCRVRLARNIADFPFLDACSSQQLVDIQSRVAEAIAGDAQLAGLKTVTPDALEQLEYLYLSRIGNIAAPTNDDGDRFDEWLDRPAVSITMRQEDHVRLQVVCSGADLNVAWQKLDQFDDRLQQPLSYAFHPRWGYLTACPANVGTGLRASVLVHLPGMVMADATGPLFRTFKRMGLIARGIYGDEAWGDFFRISNQATLGRSESEIIAAVENVIPATILQERQARSVMLAEQRPELEVSINRAVDAMRQDSDQSREETLYLWSQVRLGLSLGIWDESMAQEISAALEVRQLKHRLESAVADEDYAQAAKLQARIIDVEGGHDAN